MGEYDTYIIIGLIAIQFIWKMAREIHKTRKASGKKTYCACLENDEINEKVEVVIKDKIEDLAESTTPEIKIEPEKKEL